MRSKNPFGYQLLLDLYNCKAGVCDDLKLAYNSLDDLVKIMGMKKISNPVVVRADEKKYPHLVGYSGWIPLIESHISIHAISCTGFITIDIYSCKEFDVDVAIKFVKQCFNPTKIEQKIIYRGKEYFNYSRKGKPI